MIGKNIILVWWLWWNAYYLDDGERNIYNFPFNFNCTGLLQFKPVPGNTTKKCSPISAEELFKENDDKDNNDEQEGDSEILRKAETRTEEQKDDDDEDEEETEGAEADNEKSSKKKKMDEKVTGFTDGAEKSTSKKVEPK